MKKKKMNTTSIQNMIYEFRGQKVMRDSDLAKLYGIETKVLNQAVKRNKARFPADFMFQLDNQEFMHLKSQVVTSNEHGGQRYLPYVFTEQGVAMLSSVIRSQKAIEVNISIMRAFVAMRQYALSLPDIQQEVKELKQTLLLHIDNTDTRFNNHTNTINQIIRVLNNLTEHPQPKKRIGFMPPDD